MALDEVISSVEAIFRFVLGLGLSIAFVFCFIGAAWYVPNDARSFSVNLGSWCGG
jgi:hypothetical protein